MSNKRFKIALGVILSASSLAYATTTDPVMMRLYGARYDAGQTQDPASGTPGHIDTSFGTSGQVDFTASPHAYVTEANNGYVSAMAIGADGWMYVAFDKGDGTHTVIVKMDADGTQDTSFHESSSGAADGGSVTLAYNGAKYMGFDIAGRLIICGGDGSAAGWVTRMTTAGALDTSFGTTGYATVATGVVLKQVAEQKSGRIIAVANNAYVYAFRSTGAADNTFNPNQTSQNYYTDLTLYTSCLSNLLITSNDDICVAYKYNVSGSADNLIKFAKIKADGSGLLTTYNSTGIFNVNVAADAADCIQMTKDSDGKVYIAFTGSDHQSIKIARMASDAATSLDTYGTSGIASATGLTSGILYIARLLVDTSKKVVVAAADGSSVTKVARFTTSGSLDTSVFNPSDGIYSNAGAGTSDPGGFDHVYTAAIHPDGSILVGGDDQYGSYSHPAMIRVFGDVYDAEYDVTYSTGAAGTLDTTFGSSGSLNVSSTYSLSGYSAKKIHMFDDGSTLLAFDNATDTVKLVKLQPDMTVDTSFGASSSGIRTITSITLSDSSTVAPKTVSDLFVTRTGDIYMSGVTTGTAAGWVVKVSSAGAVDSSFKLVPAIGTAFSNISKIQQESDTKLLLSGPKSDASALYIYCVNPSTGALDTNFGASGAGYATLGSSPTGFTDITVDQYNRLYTLYADSSSSNIKLRRMLSYGLAGGVTDSSTLLTGDASTGKIVVDTTNNKIIIAAYNSTGNTIRVRCVGYAANSLTLSPEGSEHTIGTNISALADLLIDQNQNVYAVVYDTSNNMVVARFTNSSGTLTLDASYGNYLNTSTIVVGLNTYLAGQLYYDGTDVRKTSDHSSVATIAATLSAPTYTVSSGSYAGDYTRAGIAVVAAPSMTVATAAAVHPDRRVVVVGSNGSSTAYMTRLFGDAYYLERREELTMATHGTLDYVLDSATNDGYKEDSTSSASVKKVVYLNHNYDLALAIDNGTATTIKTAALEANSLDAGVATIPTGVTSMFASTYYSSNADQKLLLAGNNGGTPWLKRVTAAGNTDATFNTDGSTLSLSSSDITTANVALEQKGGRILVAGYISGSTSGVVVGYKNNGTGTDSRFGQVALAGTSNAYRTGVNAAVQAMVVDANDYIYIAYISSGTVKIEKIKPDGSGLVSGFGTAGVLTTGITSASGTVQMALNADASKLIVACVKSGTIYVGSYATADGTQDVAPASLGAFTSVTGPVLTDMQVISNNKVVLSGYDATNSTTFVARLTSLLVLDTNFNSTGYTAPSAPLYLSTELTVPYGPGLLYYHAGNQTINRISDDGVVASGQAASLIGSTYTITTGGAYAGKHFTAATPAGQPKALYALAVQDDGKVVAVGQSGINNKPTLMRLFADPYTTGLADAVGQQVAGTQDTTSDVGTALDISVSNAYKVARLVYAYPDAAISAADAGKLLFVLENGTNTYLKRVKKDTTTIDSSFNSGSVVDLGAVLNASKIVVDELENIYVAGTSGGKSWVYACDKTGAALSGFGSGAVQGASSTSANAVARQTLQRTLIAGLKSSQGAVCAYTNAAVVDTTFGGNDGVYLTGASTPISDMFVDSNDRIVIAYRSTTSIIIKRLLPNGVSLDSNFGSSGTLTISGVTTNSSGYDDQIKLHQFSNGTFAVVYKVDGTHVNMKHISASGSVSSTATSTEITDLTALTGVQADSSNRLIAVGYTTAHPWIIRYNSSFDVDATFGTAGYLLLSSGSMVAAYGATILPDRRYVLVGTDSTSSPATAYMQRVYGDSYTTVPAQNPSLARIGAVDNTLSLAADVNYVSVTTQSGISSATPAGLVAYNNTTLYMLLAGATDSYITAYNVDGVLDTTFGTSGTVTISGKDNATSMMLTKDATPKLLVAGKLSASSTAWAAEYSLAGATDASTFTAGGKNYTTISRLANVVQQSTVRTILGGKDATGIVLLGINNAGALDSSFGSGGRYTNSAETNGLSHFELDQKNRIVAAYADASTSEVIVMRLNKHGRSLDATFSSDGLVQTGVTAASATSAKVATDLSYNVYVATANSAAGIVLKRYSEDGATVDSATLGAGTTGFAAPVVTQVLVTATGKVYVLGYDENGSSDTMFVVAFTSALALDSSFGETTEGGANGAGYVTFSKTSSSASTRRLATGVVLANGRLVLAGYEA